MIRSAISLGSLGVIVAIVAILCRHALHVQDQGGAKNVPILEAPALLDLGEVELGQMVTQQFTVANRGNQELVIYNVVTSCSCSGLEQVVDGRLTQLDTLRIPAAGSADVSVRQTVGGRPGSLATTELYFQTNDPGVPQGSITVIAKVKGGVNILPTTVVFGSLQQNSEAIQIVDIYDRAASPRGIKQVVSAKPERFSVRLLPPERDQQSKASKVEGDVLIGKIEVRAMTMTPGSLDGEFLIYLNEENLKPSAFLVLGQVLPRMEVIPSQVVLPQYSAGQLVNTIRCTCRSNAAEKFILTVDHLPKGISVAIDHDKPQDRSIITISCDNSVPSPKNSTRVVRLIARTEKDVVTVNIPIISGP